MKVFTYQIYGSFNYRKIDKNHLILALQHLGRVIYAVDPDKEITESDIPVVFDKYNIYSNLDMDRLVNKKSITSDLEKLKNVIFWIDKYGRVPKANSDNVQEQKKALTIKRITEKYGKFRGQNLDEYNMNDYDKYNVEEIIRLCDENSIWELDYGEISHKQARELERVQLFKVSATKESFIDICNKIKDIAGVSSLTINERLKLLMKVLDILTENDVKILINQISEETLLKDLFVGLEENTIDDIMYEVRKLGITENYNIGNELFVARSNFYQNKSIFQNFEYNFEEITMLRRNGILTNGPDFEFIDNNGFIINGPLKLLRRNIWTGTIYSKENCTIDGYDPYDFNVKTGNHKYTNQKYNQNGFNIDHIHRDTNDIYDTHGFDINELHKDTLTKYNKRGFDIDGYWHKISDETKQRVEYSITKYDAKGFDIDGYDRKGFNRNGIHRITNEQYDELFFDKDGFYWELGANGQRQKTERKFDKNRVDREGNKYEVDALTGKVKKLGKVYDNYGFLPNGTHHITGTIVDTDGFDINGIWYKKVNGELISTGSIFDDKGWTRDRQTLRHNVYGVTMKEDGELFLDSVDDYGFDYYGRYHRPEFEIDSHGFVNFHKGTIKYSDRIMFKNRVGGEFVDVHGFKRNGINAYTGTHLNTNNFDRDGYWWKEDDEGNLYNNYSYFNDEGWSIDRRTIVNGVYRLTNERGFDIDHYYRPYRGYGRDYKHDPYGFDYYGIHMNTGTHLDEENFDVNGNWWKEDENGILRNTNNHFNDDGWSRLKTHVSTGRIVDNHGFNYLHLYVYPQSGKKAPKYSEYDRHGFDYTGIHRTTGKVYNANHFDIDGFWYKKVNGEYVKTDQKYDDKGLDIDREDKNGFTQNGYYNHSKKRRVNSDGFDKNGIHKKTNRPYDLKGRNMAGKPVENVDWDLIKGIIDEERFAKRRFIEDLIEEYNVNGYYDQIMDSFDEYNEEFEEEDEYMSDFIDYVLAYGVKRDEELYTKEDIMEYLIQDAMRRKKRIRDDEAFEYYRDEELRRMIDDGDFTYLDEQDIYRYY